MPNDPRHPSPRPDPGRGEVLTSRLRDPRHADRMPGICVSQTKSASGSRIRRPGEWRTMTRNLGRAATLIAVALAVTACGTGSYSTGSPGGGAYGSPIGGGNQATPTSTSGASVQTGSLKTETTHAGKVLAKVGVHRDLRGGLAAAGRAGQGPGGRAPARPARDDHPARWRRTGHHQRLPDLHLRRGQGPGPGHGQRHRGRLAHHQDPRHGRGPGWPRRSRPRRACACPARSG